MYSLFLDEHRSTQYLQEYQNEYMFNELVARPATDVVESDPGASGDGPELIEAPMEV